MTKRFIQLDTGLDFSIKDNETGELLYDETIVNLINEFHEENEQLKQWYINCKDENKEMGEILEDIFVRLTDLPHIKQEYCGGLFRLLGEVNDVDKAKQSIREFLYEE